MYLCEGVCAHEFRCRQDLQASDPCGVAVTDSCKLLSASAENQTRSYAESSLPDLIKKSGKPKADVVLCSKQLTPALCFCSAFASVEHRWL